MVKSNAGLLEVVQFQFVWISFVALLGATTLTLNRQTLHNSGASFDACGRTALTRSGRSGREPPVYEGRRKTEFELAWREKRGRTSGRYGRWDSVGLLRVAACYWLAARCRCCCCCHSLERDLSRTKGRRKFV